MKFMDEKGRLFGKINLFDLLVILAVLAVVAGVGYKLVSNGRQSAAAKNTTDWVITVKFAAVEPGLADAFRADSQIFYDTDGPVNARVGSVREEPAQVTVPTSDGRLVLAQDPRLLDVYAEVNVKDTNGDGVLKVGRYSLGTGGKFALKTFYAYSEGVVISIRKP